MVRKRAKRKPTVAAGIVSATTTQDNCEKDHAPPNSRSSSNFTSKCDLRDMSRDELQIFLKERGTVPVSENSPKKRSTNKKLTSMAHRGNASNREKEFVSTTTNGARLRTMEKSDDAAGDQIKSDSKDNIGDIDSDHLTLFTHPIITLDYFVRELFIDCFSFAKKVLQYRRSVFFTATLVLLFFILGHIEGPQQEIIKAWESQIRWWLYWVGLGVLSSVGLGTGLHTFVLYLGPHIAAVTMAAYECGALNFPQPPYPDQIICPTTVDALWTVSVLNIMKKVRVESMLWGAGTALGELPPYFMAKAARLSRQGKNTQQTDSEELKELEAMEALESGENIPIIMRIKLIMKHFVQKAGFLGILACASIPNPLFDLAGITCGHYLIPFWTFFGATLIGKAVVKMHIQQLAVIVAFNEELLDKAISFLAVIPYVGVQFQQPLKKYLVEQKRKLHDKSSHEGTTTISWMFEKFVMLMVAYFLVNIIHSLARSYHHRRHSKKSVD